MESTRIGRPQILWLVAGLLLGFIILGVGILISRQNRPAAIFISPPPPLSTPSPTETPGNLTIFVSGEVNRPGVIELVQGTIVQDAIEAAGGYGSNADQDLVNLAQELSDGLHIHVPAMDEDSDVPIFSSDPGQSAGANRKVNINTAELEELDTLPRIGPVIANKIIEHRESYGSFTTIESIMEVSGIGPGTYDDLKDLITVD
jgi:competence protein ComEA